MEGAWEDVPVRTTVTVIAPTHDERLWLWALTRENEPGALIDRDVRVGEVSVNGDRYDLLLLQPGYENNVNAHPPPCA